MRKTFWAGRKRPGDDLGTSFVLLAHLPRGVQAALSFRLCGGVCSSGGVRTCPVPFWVCHYRVTSFNSCVVLVIYYPLCWRTFGSLPLCYYRCGWSQLLILGFPRSTVKLFALRKNSFGGSSSSSSQTGRSHLSALTRFRGFHKYHKRPTWSPQEGSRMFALWWAPSASSWWGCSLLPCTFSCPRAVVASW